MSARAVVVLLRPFWKALPSSTPRRRSMPSAPSACTRLRMLATPSFSMRRFAARLLLTVIIASQRRRSGSVPPTDL